MDQDDSIDRAQPWYKRLYEEDDPESVFGFAIYYVPTVLVDDKFEDVRERYHEYIEAAARAVGTQLVWPAPQFRLQPLQWPSSSDVERADIAKAKSKQPYQHFTDKIEETVGEPRANGGGFIYNMNKLNEVDASPDLRAHFQQLREHFKSLLPLPRSSYSLGEGVIKPGDRSALIAGMLDNAFIVVDEYSAFSWWNRISCNGSWVWAVDPDFQDDDQDSASGLTEKYRGYVRVRLQQLVNWFYEARRFRSGDVTLQDIWNAARQSSKYAFVSLDPSDFHSTQEMGYLGSALKPKQPS